MSNKDSGERRKETSNILTIKPLVFFNSIAIINTYLHDTVKKLFYNYKKQGEKDTRDDTTEKGILLTFLEK